MEKAPRRLRLETAPPALMPEVLRVAAELHAREQAQLAEAEQSQPWVQAALEVGLPVECLERAAALVVEQEVRREAASRQRQGLRKRPGVLIAGTPVAARPSGRVPVL